MEKVKEKSFESLRFDQICYRLGLETTRNTLNLKTASLRKKLRAIDKTKNHLLEQLVQGKIEPSQFAQRVIPQLQERPKILESKREIEAPFKPKIQLLRKTVNVIDLILDQKAIQTVGKAPKPIKTPSKEYLEAIKTIEEERKRARAEKRKAKKSVKKRS